MPSNFFYWRDSKGLEIDLILEAGDQLNAIEIQSGQTIAADFLLSLKRWGKLAGQGDLPAWLIYGGDRALTNENISIVPGKNISKLSDEPGNCR